MPFITAYPGRNLDQQPESEFITAPQTRDKIGYLSALGDYFEGKRREKELLDLKASRQLAANRASQVEYPTGKDFSPLKLIGRGLYQWLKDDTQLNKEMGTAGLREGAMLAMLPAAMAVPSALGMGALARGATGGALNLAASLPFYFMDPDSADPLMDLTMGVGAGMTGLPGALIGAILGWSPDLESGTHETAQLPAGRMIDKRYAGGGLIKRGAKILKEAAPKKSKVADIIREHGGQWLDKGTLSVTDILGGRPIPNLEGTNLDKDMAYMAVSYTKDSPNKEELEAGNQWVNKKLRRYIRTQMATPEDPIRKLADQGILHVPHENLNFNPEMYSKYPFEGQRFMAKSPEARTWEGASDDSLFSTQAGKLSGGDLEVNPWARELPPDEPVYGVSEGSLPDNLGFDHLVDELRNSLDPHTDLPRQFKLTPAQLNQMGIEKAVRHVARINDWRAKNMAEANLTRSNNTATSVVKEYPEGGMKWVELKATRTEDPRLKEAQERLNQFYDQEPDLLYDFYEEKARKLGRPLTHPERREAMGEFHELYKDVFRAEEEAREASFGDLREALNYEGDTMGHCVGGYCEDVASGKTRIFSLRDDKGQPHVTIEVSPSGKEELKPYPDSINQIKGKGNAKPADRYLPYVHDFIDNFGPWESVGDIHNTNLRAAKDVFGPTELKRYEEAGHSIKPYLTLEEIQELNSLWRTLPVKKAGGGLIKRAQKILKDVPPTRSKVANVLKERGGNWMPEMGTASDDFSTELGLGFSNLLRSNEDVNRFSQGPLKKYIMRDLASPEDPIRKLAEEGIIHLPDPEPSQAERTFAIDNRAAAKKNPTLDIIPGSVGDSALARAWDIKADAMVFPDLNVGTVVDNPRYGKMTSKNPWLKEVDPEAPLYDMFDPEWPNLLGFDHMVDELSDAMNPNSDLPKELRLTPQDMKQMGVDRAVRHVHKINQWREDQRGSFDWSDFPTLKDYQDGFSWKELKHPDDPDLTREALTLEGDQMGHCVGDYCAVVEGGQSRIFSLKDEKGKPHVTVEVMGPKTLFLPNGDPDLSHPFVDEWVDKNQQEIMKRMALERGLRMGSDATYDLLDEPAIIEARRRFVEQFKGQGPFISQVKGKADHKPVEKYIPYVQDMIKELGPWSSVQELQHTDLTDARRWLEAWGHPKEFIEAALEGERTPYMMAHELEALSKRLPHVQIKPKKYASGGVIGSPEVVKIIESFGGRYV